MINLEKTLSKFEQLNISPDLIKSSVDSSWRSDDSPSNNAAIPQTKEEIYQFLINQFKSFVSIEEGKANSFSFVTPLNERYTIKLTQNKGV